MTPSRKPVFLSYASEDAEAAERICEALRAAGIEVWFDRKELRGGDAWDASIRARIGDCALFLPIVSATTEERGEGYFRFEWKLAVDRSHLMAEDQPFLLPIVIDRTPEASARVPSAFRARQWVRLPGGESGPDFVAGVQRLLEARHEAGPGEAHAASKQATRSAQPPSRYVAGFAIAAIVLAVVAAFLFLSKAPVPPPSEARATKADAAPAAAKLPPNSVAVLPFANLSEDKENEYFSDGISEELLTVLQKISGLPVAARSSSFSFKGANATAQEIGARLGVTHLVEGSVRKSGKSVRIAARLSRAATGEQLWSDAYTRDLSDVFAVQSELAQAIAVQLRSVLGGDLTPSAKAEIRTQVEAAVKGGTKNAEAHQLYLQGLFHLHRPTEDDALRSQGFLERAVALDPRFALAWAALSRAGSWRAGFASTKRGFEDGWAVARRGAKTALDLEPDLPAGHLARMSIQMWNEFDWKAAAASLARARAAAPTDVDVMASAAYLALAVGRKEEAVEAARQVIARDPLNAEMRMQLGWALDSVGRYREAQAQFERVIELSPEAPWGHSGVAMELLHQARFDAALREVTKERTQWARLPIEAGTLWALKKKPESDAALARLVAGFGEIAAIQIAQAHAYRGENDRAFEWLERAAKQRDSGIAWTKSASCFAPLHADPRWPKFLATIGLADDQLR